MGNGQDNNQDTSKIIQLSTFRPEKCGIASWTEDVINYCHKNNPSLRNRVFVVNGYRKPSEYTDFVDFCIEKNDLSNYIEAAKIINNDPDVKLVSIQHEFGIFGGHMGDYIIPFLDSLTKPNLVTLHTVPRDEERDYKTIERKKTLKKILPRINQAIVISDSAKNILIKEYDADKSKLNVILHGVHDFNESPEASKQILGLQNKFVISTVGLVRPKRGLEHVIKSLPPVFEKYPDAVYVLAGETHPREIVDGRDIYREMLTQEVEKLGIKENVVFVNNYLPLNSLLRHIQASDIGITPYTFPGQVSSGVLSYYVGMKKPVISTPFLYAQELLAKGRGIILPDFNNSKTISQALLNVVKNEKKINKIKENISKIKEVLRWINVAGKYIDVEKWMIESFNK